MTETLALFLLTALALRTAAAALRAYLSAWHKGQRLSLEVTVQALAWFLAFTATWFVASAFGIWAPLWLIAPLTVIAVAANRRYNSASLWFLWFTGDLLAILLYSLLSQFAVNLFTLLGVAMIVGITGSLLDKLFGTRPLKALSRRPLLAAVPFIALLLLAIFLRPLAFDSALRLLQNRLFTMSTLATITPINNRAAPDACAPVSNDDDPALVRSNDSASALGHSNEQPDQTSVGQWRTYEITLQSTGSYGNPFTDVDVYADFTSPDNQTIRIYAFYDGDGQGGQGNLWKIRFTAGQQGLWTWRTVANVPSDDGLHNQTGQVSIVPSDEPGPLAPDPQYPTAWRHANGQHFLWSLGYSIHMLGADRTHPGVGGWEDYLDWLQAHRLNGVMFTLQVPSFSACSTCAEGVAPWSAIGNNPPPTYAFNRNNTVDYFVMPWARRDDPDDFGPSQSATDFNRFYLPLWHKLDQIVLEMQQRDMVAHLLQYDDQTFWPPAASPQERLYWDYMLRRLGAYWNVTFNDGIDLFEYRPAAWVPTWQQYFCDNDPFDHPRSSRHGDDDISTATWRSVQAANDSQPRNIGPWRNLMDRAPQKPVTEDDGIRARVGAGIPPDRFMQLAWWSAMSGPGAFGATWAGAHDPGNWYANLDQESEGMLRVEIRNRFLLDFDPGRDLSIPFWKLRVHDDLASGDNVYVVAQPGRHYLVHFDQGAPRDVTLDLTTTHTALPVTWLNPATGQRQSSLPTEPGTVQSFRNPFRGPAVLYIGAGEKDNTTPLPDVDCTTAVDCMYVPLVNKQYIK